MRYQNEISEELNIIPNLTSMLKSITNEYLYSSLIKVISFIFFLSLTGCYNNAFKTDDKNPKIINLSSSNSPKRIVVDSSNLIIKSFGNDGVTKPKPIITPMPQKQSFRGYDKVIPGTSFIPAATDNNSNNEKTVKSKLPKYKRFRKGDDDNQKNTKLVSVNEVKVLPTVEFGYDSIKKVTDYLLENKHYEVTENHDTILPPISIIIPQPGSYKAMPFNYKENALFDISVLETTQALPNPFIRSIETDKNDVIWLGTHTGGIVSYDGEYFMQHDDPRRQTSQPILAMIIDSKDNIWFGTTGGGAFCYDGIRSTQYTKAQGLLSNDITDIIEDSKGNIWFATPKGVSKLKDNQIVSYSEESGLPMNYVFTIFEDDSSNIWFGTMGGGVAKFDGKKFFTINEENGLCGNRILAINQDKKGNYWFGSYGNGVSKFNGHEFVQYNLEQGLSSNVVLSIAVDSENNVWFGTYGNGLMLFDGIGFYHFTTNQGLSYDYIRALFVDEHDNIWIGTDGSGISKFNFHSFKLYTDNQGLKNENVTAIYEDNDDRLLLSPFEEGLLIFDKLENPGELKQFTQISSDNGFNNNIILNISQDENNNYWIGTFKGGVSKIDYDSFINGKISVTNYDVDNLLNSNIVRSIITDRNNNQWFATEGGVTMFDGEHTITYTEKAGLGDNNVLIVYEDTDGYIWAGTMDGGVNCIKKDTIICYTTENGLPNNTVWNIEQDSIGNFWFGTNGGLTGFNHKSFRTISKSNGLSANIIFSLIKDKNEIFWAGTIKGLNQIKIDFENFFNQSNGKLPPYEINIFDQMDGLKGLDFTAHSVQLDNMNCLWWGTDKALTMLDLNTYNKHSYIPYPRVTDVLLEGSHRNFLELKEKSIFKTDDYIEFDDVYSFNYIPKGLSLPYDINHITFEYSATDWLSSDQLFYQYMISGFDKGWNLPVKVTSVDYRNLKSGDYVFKLRAKGRSGVWSNVYEYPFEIRQAWYLRWYVLLIYLAVFVFFIWLIIRWRVSIVQRQKNILESMVSRRTKELNKALVLTKEASNAKNQFIATISHELRTPLNAILGLTNLALKNNKDLKIDDYLRKVESSSVTLLGLINEILDFSKIEAGKMKIENIDFNLQSVLTSVVELNSSLAKQKNLEFIINVDRRVPNNLVGDPLRLGQIITNLTNNAIKFTDKGEIVIDISIEEFVSDKELYLEVSVTDTGIGIPKEIHNQLFDKFQQADASITRKYGGTGLGLSICKLLIEMMDGQIWLQSDVGKGSKFSFDCKVGLQQNQEIGNKKFSDEIKQKLFLVCSDNEKNIQSITNILESAFLKVISANTAEETSDIFNREPVKVIIFEAELGGIKILETITDYVENNPEKQIKTIVLAYDENEVSSNSLTKKVDDVVLKPVTRKTLFESIELVNGISEVSGNLNKQMMDNDIRLKMLLSGKKVLLADDNVLNQQIMTELLSIVGISADCVENGKEATEKFNSAKYDLVLMDLHMPVMDGFAATTSIRYKDGDIPVIALTADMRESISIKCEKAGINDIINKPIDADYLYSRLVFWLANDDYEGFANVHQISPSLSDANIDYKDAIQRLGGDEFLYIKMFKKFASSLERTIGELESLLINKSYERAHFVAHNLKGESGNVGANRVYKLAYEIEKQIEEKNISNTSDSIDQLKSIVSEIINFPDYYESNIGSIYQIHKTRPINQVAAEMISAIEKHDPNIFNLLDELEKSNIDINRLSEIKDAISTNNVTQAKKLVKRFLN